MTAGHRDILDRFLFAANCAAVVSFDLFDTLLVRIFGRPVDLFSVISDRLAALDLVFARRFAQERIQAEIRARESARRCGDNEVTLASIYAELAAALDPDPHAPTVDLQSILELECELEIASVRADEQVKAAFDDLIARGARVVIVSDMYLPLPCIQSMLTRLAIRGHERLYLSNECGAAKANGSVWPHLRADLALAPDDVVVHLGDNAEADGAAAARFGVRPFLLTEPQGRRLPRPYPAKGQWFHDCCLALLQQSLVRHPDNPRVDPFWLAIAHLIVLPAALGMAAFVRDLADQEKTDRIFFLARDGLIFQKAFEAAWRRPGDARSRYVWASRRCLNVAMIEELDAGVLDFLVSGTSSLTVADFVRRIDLDPAEPSVHSAMRRHFPEPAHGIATEQDRETLRAMFRDLEPAIRGRASQERAPLVTHLDELGLFDGPGIVVDLGWHGTMQRSLITLGQRRTGRIPCLVGAYLGTFERRVRTAAGRDLRSSGWLFNGEEPRAHAAVIRRSVEVVELLFSAPESGIKHLQTRGGQIEPVRIVEAEEGHRIEIASIIHDAVKSACTALRPFVEGIPREVFKAMALENLEALLATPSSGDAAMFRDIAHAEGFGIARYRPIIQPRPVVPHRWALFNAQNSSFWPAGFRASMGRRDKITLEMVERLHRLRRHVRRLKGRRS